MATSKKTSADKKASKTSSAAPKSESKPKTKPAASTATTMEELLAQTGYTLKGLKKGDVLEGTVSRVGPKEIAVHVGGKTEGVVIDRELENYKDALLTLKPGDMVIAQVIVAENDRGQSVLSLRRFIFDKRWNDLAAFQKSGQAVEVTLRESVRGGVLADYGGLRGYIPQSQLDMATSKQTERLTGRKAMVKVIEVDKETNRLVLSQRAIAEDAALSRQKELIDAIKVDETVSVNVTGVVPFGAFAKFTVSKDGKDHEVEGLIHISEIAWEKVEDPNQYLKAGETIKAKIVAVDEKTGKVTLSLKQLLPDPWDHVLDMFEKDSEVKGTVSRVSPYGIFVTLSPGIEGLIHISKVNPGEEPKVGAEITCTIEDIKADQRKISLAIALTEKPMGYR